MSAQVCRKTQVCLADDCYSTRYACEGKTQAANFLSMLDAVEQRSMYKGEIELPDGIENIISGGEVSKEHRFDRKKATKHRKKRWLLR